MLTRDLPSEEDFILSNLDHALKTGDAASDVELDNANAILGGFIGMGFDQTAGMTPDTFLNIEDTSTPLDKFHRYRDFINDSTKSIEDLMPEDMREWENDRKTFVSEAEAMFPDKEQGAAYRDLYVFNKLADKVDKENGWTGKVKDAVKGAIYNVGDAVRDGGIDEIGLSEEDIWFLPESQRDAAREIHGFNIRSEESARFRLKSLKEKATGTGVWSDDRRLELTKYLDAARMAGPGSGVYMPTPYSSQGFDPRRLTDREVREMKWLEERLSGDGSGFMSYDAKAAKKAEKEFREMARRGRAVAKKEEELTRYAIGLRMQRVRPSLLDEDSYSLMEDSIESHGLAPVNYERFKALPNRDKAMIAPILSAMKGKRKGGFLYDAGAEFINTAIDVGKSAVMAPVNEVMMHLVDPEQYQEHMAYRAFLEQATYQNRGDYRYKISDWMIDAVATVPYMAAAALPYGIGFYAMGAQFADAADKAVAARGGDLYDPNYRWLKLTTAVAYSAVERLQVMGMVKPVNPITRGLYALETSARISKPMQMMFRGGRLFVKWGRNTAWESAEEGIQGGLEGALQAYGCGEDIARSIAEQSVDDFAGSLGSMGVLSAFGRGSGVLRSSPTFTQAGLKMSAEYANAELEEFKGMNGPADVARSGKLGEFEHKLGEVNRGYKEAGGRDGHGVQYLISLGYTSEQAGKVSRLIDSLDQALTSDKGVVSDAEYESMSEAEREGVVSESMRQEMVKHSMAGRGMRKRLDIVMDMIAPKGSNVSVTEDENGDITYEGTIKGRDGKEKKFRNTIHFVERDPITVDQLDPKSPDFDPAIAQEFEDEINRARWKDTAITGKEFVPFHLEEFNAADRSVREAKLAEYDLSKPGKFHMENGITSEGLEVMTGRIDIEKSANLKTVLHEHLHSFVRMLRESGEITDEDVKNAVKRFGKPRIRGELFNEEAAADEYMEMAGRGVFLIEHSAMEKVYLKANEMLDAGLAIMRINKMEAAYRKELQDGFFASVKNGNFNGIPSVYPGKLKANLSRKGKDQPEDKGKASQEEGRAGEEPAPDTDGESVRTTWVAKSNDGSKTYSGSYVILDAENLVIDPDEDMDGVSEITSPEDMEDTGALDSGMPIVDGDGNVLVGGRTAYGLRMAAASGRLGKIEEHAREQAKLMGVEIPGDIKHPVLLRARNPEMTQEEVDGLRMSARLPLSESEEVEDKAQAAARVVNASPDKKALVKAIDTDDQLRDGITAVFPDSPQIQEVTAGLVTDADRIKTRKISEGLKDALPAIMDAKEKNGASGIDVEIPWALSQVTDFMRTEKGRRGNTTDFVRFQRRTVATETVPEDVNRLAREIYKRRKDKVAVGKLLKGYANGLREGLDTHDALELEMLNEGETRYSISKIRGVQEAERQYREVRDKCFGTSAWMRAPNGKPTRLTERQWVQVRTPNFKRWFGDWENDPANASKVVDENGEPRVVYHGTNSRFFEFSRDKIGRKHKHLSYGDGYYFSADYYDAQTYGRNIIEAFLNIRRPSLSDTTMRDGSDGITAIGAASKVFIVFSSSQIKSATDNVGTFDGANPDIRYSLSKIAPTSPGDRAYMYAVERGDMDEAQRMVNERVMELGGTFHRGKAPDATEYIVEFSDDPYIITSYGEHQYALLPNQLTDIPDYVLEFAKEYARSQEWQEDVTDEAIEDAVAPKDIVDSAGLWDDAQFVSELWERFGSDFTDLADKGIVGFKTPDGAVAWPQERAQYKVADPVTYDDAGNVIPISQRFDSSKDDPRYSISKIRGVYGGDNLYTAFMIGEVLNKRYEKRDPADYETIRRVFGAKLSPDEAHDVAVRYLEEDHEGRARKLYKRLTPAKAMAAVGSELEKSQIGKIMAEMGRGASFGAAYGSLASNTFMNQQKRAVKDARGAHLADLEAAYGVDISSIAEAASERAVADARRKRAEKSRKKKPGADAESSEGADEDEEGVVIETDDDPGSDVSTGRQEEIHSRLETLFAELKKINDPALREELIKKYQIAEKDKDVADSILREKMIFEFGADVMADGGVLDLVATLVRDYVRVAHGGHGDKMWLDAGAIETYKLTMADVLTQLMRDMVPVKRGNDRVNITKTIESMKSVYPSTIKTVKDGLRTKATIDRLAKKAVVQIQKASVKATKRSLVRELDKYMSGVISKKNVELDEVSKKTVDGQYVMAARAIRRAVHTKPEDMDEKVREINEKIGAVERAYEEKGAVGSAEDDIRLVQLNIELMALQSFGHLAYESVARISEASDFIHEYFDVGLERLLKKQEARRKQVEEEVKLLRSVINTDKAAAIDDSIATRLGNWAAATLRSRLMAAVAGAKDDASRERARALVDEIMFTVEEGSQKRDMLNQRYTEELYKAIERSVEGTGHDVKWFVKKLDEQIPNDLSQKITRQGMYDDGRTDSRMTYNQLLNLYGYLCQTSSYGTNIEKHDRQGQKELIEAHLTPEMLRFVQRLREAYEARRAELSFAMMEVTGLPVYRPDPMYLPERMNVETSSGLSTQTFSVKNAIAPSLTPRVRNSLDVDEKVGITDLYETSSRQVANVVAFGERGVYLRDVLTDGGFLGDIKKAYGRGEAEGLRNQVTDVITDGYNDDPGSDRMGTAISYLNSMATYTSLSYNLVSAAKQIAGIPSWIVAMHDGTYREMWRYVLQGFDKEAARELMSADGYYARYGRMGVGREALDAILHDPNVGFGKKFVATGMTPLQWVDLKASMIVGVGFYKAKVQEYSKRGFGDAEAKRRAAISTWAAIERAQQSDKLENTNEFMRRQGWLAKSVMKFASSPILQASNEIQARRIARRSGRHEDKVRRNNIIFANHVFIPLMMHVISLVTSAIMGEDRDKEWWEIMGFDADSLKELVAACVLGQFGRILFFGSLSDTAIRTALGLKTWHSSGVASYDYMFKMVRHLGNGGRDLVLGEFDDAWESFIDAFFSSTAASKYAKKGAENWGLFGVDKED